MKMFHSDRDLNLRLLLCNISSFMVYNFIIQCVDWKNNLENKLSVWIKQRRALEITNVHIID